MHSTRKTIGGRRLAAFALGLLVPAIVGCAASGKTAGNPLDSVEEDIELLVRNFNFHQVTVYTARGGPVRRLGIVPGKGEATFTMRWHLPDLQLRVKQLAGEDFYTETIPVSPGELLELIIPAR